jgi:16S rRNA (cytosine1402-N4)-methyltransferase
MSEQTYHTPVLLCESIEGLNIKANGIYVDVTYGGGGHSKAILEKIVTGKLVAFDHDADAESNLLKSENLIFVNQNFRFIKNHLRFKNLYPVDGVLADLGVSSHHFDKAERGFSIRFDADLDMRMNKNLEKTAAYVINKYSEVELKKVFFEYGELNQASAIARSILKAREDSMIKTTEDLKNVLKHFIGKDKPSKFYAKVFQALRIEVNDEMGALKDFLLSMSDVLKSEGRLVVITYHSLEDRMVKNFIRSGNIEGVQEKDFYGNLIRPFKPLFTKPITPNQEELLQNSRARSAKLRVAERVKNLE